MAPPRPLLAFVVLWSAFASVSAVAPNNDVVDFILEWTMPQTPACVGLNQQQEGLHEMDCELSANCDLLYGETPISDSSWYSFLNVSIYQGPLKDDTAPQAVYLSLNTKEVTGFQPVTQSNYIDVQLDTQASTLNLVITDAFTSYEEDMISSSTAAEINIEISLTCSDGNSAPIKFRTTVEDVNNHAPVFESPSYEYELPMPLPSEIDLSCIVGVISVADIDISNSAITIEFDPDGAQLLRAETSYLGNRNYAVHISSRTAIELKETTSFTMTAMDNGVPQKSSQPATITIKVNQETSPPTAPLFEQPALHETVRAEDIMAGNIIASATISEGYDTDVKVTHRTIDDAGLTPSSDKFSLEKTPGATAGTATISLRWADGVTSQDIEDLKYALIVIEATRDRGLSTTQTATTVIHLSLPGLEEQSTTACPTAEPTTQCPEPEPCICTTSSTEPTTSCPEPEPCICTTSSTEPTTQCPEPDPCICTSPSTEPTPTPESTTCPNSGITDPTWPTVPYPPCNSSDVTEPCICPAPSQCTTVETTSPGCPTDCSQCTTTVGPPTSSDTASPTDSTEYPTTCPTISPTSPNTGSPTGSTEGPASPTTCTPCEPCPTAIPTPSTTGSPTESTVCPVCPTTCAPCEACPTAQPTSTTPALPPGPPIEFARGRYSASVASDYHGLLVDLALKDSSAADGYTLLCQVLSTDYVSSRVSATPAEDNTACRLSADVILDPGSYSLAVVASLAGTSSTATAQVALGVSAMVSCNGSSPAVFSHALLLAKQPENLTTPQTVVPAAQLTEGAHCNFTGSVDPVQYSDWVTVDEKTGEVSVTGLDYERVTNLVISLSASCDSEQQQQQLRASRDLFSKDLFSKDQPEWPRELRFNPASMSVLLQIQDVNDNPPVFTAGDRLVVGYPTGDLLERVQPGPVITLTATDADEGENAELLFRLDGEAGQRFTIQPQTGAVYLRSDATDLPAAGASFTATVLDLAGAEGALTDSINVQVKPLDREELVMVTTVEGALPEDADAVVEELGAATGLAVRLLRAYAAPSHSPRAEVRAAEAGAALTLMLYALDDKEALITVNQFQELLSSSDVDLLWEVSRVENLPPEAENQGPADVTGYMAAIIALAVLIAVAVVAVGVGYYFYFRPRMGVQKQKGGYTEFTSGAEKPSPLESQIPQITTTVEPNISTVSEIIEPVNKLTVENNIQKHENSNGVLTAGLADDDWPRKRSVNIRGGPDDYDVEAHRGARRSESSDSLDGDGGQAEPDQHKSSLDEDEAHAEAERRKSMVHFNENVECIEVDRL